MKWLFFVILILLLGLIFFPPFDMFAKATGMGFFKAYSNSKLILFISLLFVGTLLVGISRFNWIKKPKMGFLKVFDNKLPFLRLLFAIILLVLAFLNFFSFLVYSNTNNVSIATLSYVIYSDSAPAFTVTSITHNHAMKPILFPLTFFIPNVGDFYGMAWGFFEFMPEWFPAVWLLGFGLYAVLLILALFALRALSKKWPKDLLWPFTWLFIASFFLVSKTIIDGGIFTNDFIIGLPFFLYLVLGNPQRLIDPVKHYFKYWFLPTFAFNSIPMVLYFFSGVYPEELMVIGVLLRLVMFSGFLVFMLGIYALISLAQQAKQKKFKLSSKTGKIKTAKTIGLIVLFIGMVFFLNTFFPRNFIGPMDQLTKPIPVGEKYYVYEDALRDPSKFKVIDGSKEMLFLETIEETNLAAVSEWPTNLKTVQYFIKWKSECDLLATPKKIFIITNDDFTLNELRSRIPQQSMFKAVNIERCTESNSSKPCDYLLTLYFDYRQDCLAEFRVPVKELLIRMGFTNFILH